METSPAEFGFFDRDTELVPAAGGELEGSISHRWDARGGPHGGYLAALILRGMTIAIADASRRLLPNRPNHVDLGRHRTSPLAPAPTTHGRVTLRLASH